MLKKIKKYKIKLVYLIKLALLKDWTRNMMLEHCINIWKILILKWLSVSVTLKKSKTIGYKLFLETLLFIYPKLSGSIVLKKLGRIATAILLIISNKKNSMFPDLKFMSYV